MLTGKIPGPINFSNHTTQKSLQSVCNYFWESCPIQRHTVTKHGYCEKKKQRPDNVLIKHKPTFLLLQWKNKKFEILEMFILQRALKMFSCFQLQADQQLSVKSLSFIHLCWQTNFSIKLIMRKILLAP